MIGGEEQIRAQMVRVEASLVFSGKKKMRTMMVPPTSDAFFVECR